MANARQRNKLTVAAALLVVVAVVVGVFVIRALTASSGAGLRSPTPGLDGPDPAAIQAQPLSCADLSSHMVMMQWNADTADQIIGEHCKWPYVGMNVTTAGGKEDPTLTAPFEPRKYRELSTILTQQKMGICRYARLPVNPLPGFVFGFRIAFQPNGCAGSKGTANIAVSEWATRALRDSAAHALTKPNVMVLGRWTVSIYGTNTAAIDRATTEVMSLGASPVK